MEPLDQLHVVSDLHLGGIPGHQIFNQGRALAALIDHLRGAAEHARVGLVLNGDIVDFLASEDARYLDPAGATRKLEAIFEDEAFRPVFDALASFVRAPRAVLALVLGNHDVELALPHVTEQLLARIAGDDRAARDRVRLGLDGRGYTCRVGGRKVVCVHGNQADPWNPVDFAALKKVARAIEAGERIPRWEPNAGTRLVVDVMNDIKLEYAFVDLLKPETVPVPTVLLALPMKYRAPLFSFAKIAARRLVDEGRLATGFLSGGAADRLGSGDELDGARALEILIRPEMWADHAYAAEGAAAEAPVDAPRTGEDWLRQACEDHAAGLRPADLVGALPGDTLGIGRLLREGVMDRDHCESLRTALSLYLERDQSFRFDVEDDTFRKLDAAMGDADFVIAGHTHLARSLPRRRGPGFYFNSGTWIRLIQLERHMLTREGFAPVYDALRAGTLEALDAIPGLVLQRRTVVAIWTEGNEVRGELRSALPAGGDEAPDPPWRPEPRTRRVLPRRDTQEAAR